MDVKDIIILVFDSDYSILAGAILGGLYGIYFGRDLYLSGLNRSGILGGILGFFFGIFVGAMIAPLTILFFFIQSAVWIYSKLS